jgi:hypothetical protein
MAAMITAFRGFGFIRSSGRQYFLCHDCGAPIEIIAGKPEHDCYPIVLEMDDAQRVAKRIKYLCVKCTTPPPAQVAPLWPESPLPLAK